MDRTPIFSTFRQGENRVTSSMLAVFERIGLSLVERILATASGESSFGLVSFRNQPGQGGVGVPDGEIAARFRYLFEVKTAINAFRSERSLDQVRRHLERLDDQLADERLFVITPDPEQPAKLTSIDDERMLWINFAALKEGIDDVVSDPAEPASEQQRFLLRELVALLEADGLVGVDDTVIVAARLAYPNYAPTSAYICQPNRAFRDVTYMGFYADKQIKPELPRILRRYPEVEFSLEEADRREATGDRDDAHVAAVIRYHLAKPERVGSPTQGIFLLSGPNAEGTVLLGEPVDHTAGGAWVQGQRYTSVARLREASDTGDL